MWVVCLMSRSFYRWGNSSRPPLNMKLASYQNRSGPGQEEKNFLSPDGFGTRLVRRSVIKIPAELSRGQYKWSKELTAQVGIRVDAHEFVHRDIITKATNEMQLYKSIYRISWNCSSNSSVSPAGSDIGECYQIP